MPKKRKSGGRGGGGKGRSELVQCSACGALVPRDKVKRVTTNVSLLDPQLAKELRAQGAYIGSQKIVRNYCISCAIFHRIVKVRSKDERKLSRRY
ncbi:30S ribosomal protein S26e [Candidatus Bathyarchaeota archaeon]|nr:30S ribosomal protein S26e [Candidatus Bathyarchaeota archaeon]MBS7627457.1 30S ribosomal protein S26e [Candidatus Bathyarchaeota archaeon]